MKFPVQVALMALAIMALSMSLLARATETEHREHGAHEHGHAMLSIVIDGNALAIELEVPAVNVVGFEHEPSDDKQRQAVEDAVANFKRSDTLFVLPQAAGCRSEMVEVTLAGDDHHKNSGHTSEAPAQDQKSGDAEKKGEVHSELHAEYRYHCNSPEKLESLEVRLFDHLMEVDDIDVQVVTPTIQMATELNAGDAVVKFVRE